MLGCGHRCSSRRSKAHHRVLRWRLARLSLREVKKVVNLLSKREREQTSCARFERKCVTSLPLKVVLSRRALAVTRGHGSESEGRDSKTCAATNERATIRLYCITYCPIGSRRRSIERIHETMTGRAGTTKSAEKRTKGRELSQKSALGNVTRVCRRARHLAACTLTRDAIGLYPDFRRIDSSLARHAS